MKKIAILSTYLPFAHLAPLLKAADPDLDVTIWPDPACLDAEMAACLHPPAHIYEQMPNLKLIHCVSAGVDSILVDQNVGTVPVCRVVDPTLSDGMVQYVLWGVIYFHRQFDKALLNQQDHAWRRLPRTDARTFQVGIMGLGQLGGPVAERLVSLGYAVSGWTRTPRTIDGVENFFGEDQLDDFLRTLDAVVCCLPLTDETRGILDAAAFTTMKEGSVVIACGRGEHFVPADLAEAVRSGHLRGALLDVFPDEPLPASDPFWSMPGVTVTPHMASTASDTEIARQLVANIRNWREGKPLAFPVDLVRGY